MIKLKVLNLKRILLAIVAVMLTFASTPVLGVFDSGQTDLSNQQYSISGPSDAPTPVDPGNPESMGIQIPSETASTYQSPTTVESEQALIPISDPTVSMPIVSNQASKYSSTSQSMVSSPQPTMSSTQAMIVAPPGSDATNKLYVASVSQTVAGSSLYGWMPVWVQNKFSGPVWIYEWYPDGRRDVKYLGQSYPGWDKIWFYSDSPGWHTLQFYCGGWSNYIYIYVYGSRHTVLNAPVPNPAPSWPHYDPWLFTNLPKINSGTDHFNPKKHSDTDKKHYPLRKDDKTYLD